MERAEPAARAKPQAVAGAGLERLVAADTTTQIANGAGSSLTQNTGFSDITLPGTAGRLSLLVRRNAKFVIPDQRSAI